MSRAWLGLFIIVFASTTLCTEDSRACSCAQAGPAACPDFKASGLAFVGTVIDIENAANEERGADQSGLSRYRFRVDENLNGFDVTEVDVYSGRGGADCSYHFQPGIKYLVNPYPSNGRFFATICSDTQPATEAEPLLSELRARRDGKKHASVYGVLRRIQQPYAWTSYDDYDQPLSRITVELLGENYKLSTQTDDNGVYRFYGVPADTYYFAATLPPSLELAQTILSDPPPPITIPDDACFQQDIDALPTAHIHGRVIGPDGKPLKNADVALFRKDRYKESDMGWWEFQGEEKGYFQFDHVAPGTYVLVFHNSNRPDPDIPYPRTFFPSAPDFETALPITIAEGQQLLDADIHVSGGPPTRPLTVQVNWSENPTPDDVFVHATAADGAQPLPTKLSSGVYQLTLFRGTRYTIFAQQDCGLRWDGNTGTPVGARETERVEVDGSDDRTTKITLTMKDTTCNPYKKEIQQSGAPGQRSLPD
jgi:hypothetical protein